jgi:SAM-dependent methyltransferase
MGGFIPPPAWIMYDAFGSVDYRAYHDSGQLAAHTIAGFVLPFLERRGNVRILEWGCGPGRIVRHISRAFEPVAPLVYATDYNRDTIMWCRGMLPNIQFETNGLLPPLPFPEAVFDCVYCISVFTHLSEESHHQWLKEIRRVLAPGGIALITTHGDRFRSKLLASERELYDAGKLVVRGAVKEGSRVYSTYHSPRFMRDFLGKSDVLLHEPSPERSISGGQDVWVIRR